MGLLFYTVKSSADTQKQKSGSPGFAEHEMPEHSKVDKMLNGEELGPKISILTQVDVDMHGGRDILRYKLTTTITIKNHYFSETDIQR